MTTVDPFLLAADAFAPREPTLADEEFPTPGALAQALDPTMQNPPHLQKIDEAVVNAAAGTGPRRVLISMPPQEGKSERAAHYTPLWLLRANPDLRIAIVSYEDEAAKRWGRFIRDDIDRFDLGLRIREDVKAAGRWYIDGHKGSVFCTSAPLGALTGQPVDVLIIDDPVKGPAEADSPANRKALWNWWLAVARARLGPGAIVIVIMTRWHPEDLGGQLVDAEGDVADGGKWLVIRIPALAEADDPIGRKPGQWLPSARGRTTEEWEEIHAGQIDRWWNAMYQGRPTPPEGAVWQHAWIDDHRRRSVQVPDLVRVAVMVDPSGSSKDDAAETGIVVVALGLDGHVYVFDDRSLRAPAATRALTVCESAVEWSADEILVEEDFGGDNVEQLIRASWAEYARSELRLRRLSKVPTVRSIRAAGKGAKRLRAETASGFYKQGLVHHVLDDTHPDRLDGLERQMVEWNGDGPSPDRVDALSHGVREMLAPVEQAKAKQVVARGRWQGVSGRR